METKLQKIGEVGTLLFPAWVLIGSILSFFFPQWFTWFTGPAITYGLGFTMLGMGITLLPRDFRNIFKTPIPVFIGVALQYTVMPVSGWGIGVLLDLPIPLATGLVVVSCCPGGVASNVITYLAKGDLALSVSMTASSTILSVFMTPLLTLFLIGKGIDVSTSGLFLDTFQVVILPIVLGVLLNVYFPEVSKKIQAVSPLVAVFLITMIVSSILGAGKEKILQSAGILIFAVLSLHISGFFFGYVISWLFIRKQKISRTISIEVGMQNSGLGVVLSRNNFPDPLVAIPAAISSLVHSLIGSLLAVFWRKLEKETTIK
ncbi:bile acid:sodium symporter family protein [Leptospira interrogans]|uniref:Sodium Bile acid symporter family protein n=5 Tax=Leptospira interrogans TaxID=173 RepID=A0A0E2DDS7_LEPIR|nr:bile acid:sodium symporter family protein [Leptospira interrogans]EMF40913.1 sodium Bile acid symporter family protein [Leptospira interrogans serovar Lora str. TE 1992]EMF74252.1 sodium Bile acid symporter family protein [Leptospira interrogans serovar Canicola str. LT1962]EMG08906.1 sodium Bile acid symporter family protein [Leptospira interrogans serovar Grippotyphosa str. LT2186]EMM79104.1 sodium Bile acid symporter family protein [Leptospira interrogans str. 2006001854]EMN73800.1 sodiu